MSEEKKIQIPDNPDEFEVEWPDPRPDAEEEPTEPWARRDQDSKEVTEP